MCTQALIEGSADSVTMTYCAVDDIIKSKTESRQFTVLFSGTSLLIPSSWKAKAGRLEVMMYMGNIDSVSKYKILKGLEIYIVQ